MFIYCLLQKPIWRIYDLWSSEQTHVSVFLTHPVLFCQETILLRPYFLPFVSRKDHPISVGIFHLAGTDGMTPDLQREPVDSPSEPWRFNNLSHPCSNTSLKVWKTHLSHFVTVPGRTLWSDARRWLKNFPEIGPVTSWILTSRKKRWWKFGCSKHPREGTFLLKKEWLSVFRISSVCVCVFVACSPGTRGSGTILGPVWSLIGGGTEWLHIVADGNQAAGLHHEYWWLH